MNQRWSLFLTTKSAVGWCHVTYVWNCDIWPQGIILTDSVPWLVIYLATAFDCAVYVYTMHVLKTFDLWTLTPGVGPYRLKINRLFTSDHSDSLPVRNQSTRFSVTVSTHDRHANSNTCWRYALSYVINACIFIWRSEVSSSQLETGLKLY